ncbi:MAG: hypothetical protein IJ091_06285, partial [Oscillospiraceae bacterium]|nr:hypothetical protein [Oscillospiraceae bacterium]
KILRGGKQVFHDRLDKTLYITATDLIFGAKNVEKETYTCPNCGNVTTIGELREGCPYCGTHFEMQELYPRVGGLYYVKEIGGTEKEVKKDVMRYMIPVIVAFGIFGLITVLFAEDRGSIVWLLQSIFMMAFTLGVGAFVGYMIWAILKLGSIFYEAGKALPSLPGVLGSRKKFETRMKELSPDFSYDYFANKVGTLVKMMIFSPDPALLPICVGDHMENPFQDVVDAQFRGPVIMKSFKMDGNTVHVRADAEFDLLLTKGSVFWKKRQFIPLYMSRDCSMRFRTNYSVKKVSCRNCGGSFDATRKDRCPYCGTEYDIRKEDWYITGFSQK